MTQGLVRLQGFHAIQAETQCQGIGCGYRLGAQCVPCGSSGRSGDKLSAIHGIKGAGLLAYCDQVAVSTNVHAVMRDGGSGVAAFIEIIDG